MFLVRGGLADKLQNEYKQKMDIQKYLEQSTEGSKLLQFPSAV
jgi:hypothetical protein